MKVEKSFFTLKTEEWLCRKCLDVAIRRRPYDWMRVEPHSWILQKVRGFTIHSIRCDTGHLANDKIPMGTVCECLCESSGKCAEPAGFWNEITVEYWFDKV